MMRILGCIFSLLLLSLAVNAQDSTWSPNGLRVGVDVIKPILSFINDQPKGAEFSIDYEVKENYYAVLEGGFRQQKLDEVRYSYNTKGIYGRIGVDYNFLKKRANSSGEMAFVGIRYGYSSFSLNADSILLSESYWGNLTTSVPKTTLSGHWAELVLGIKAEVAPSFSMGWTVRAGFLLSGKLKKRDIVPATVPGYGKTSKSPVMSFTYSLFYTF